MPYTFKNGPRKDRSPLSVEVLVILSILLIVVLGFIQPYFEMRAFNKFSEEKATYWDAMFSQLRINNER